MGTVPANSTAAQIGGWVAVVLVLLIVATLVRRFWRVSRPVTMTSDKPPQFKGRLGRRREVLSFTGYVEGIRTGSSTSVSGTIGTSINPGTGNTVQGTIHSQTNTTESFRLVNAQGVQNSFDLMNYHAQIWDGQLVSVSWVAIGKEKVAIFGRRESFGGKQVFQR